MGLRAIPELRLQLELLKKNTPDRAKALRTRILETETTINAFHFQITHLFQEPTDLTVRLHFLKMAAAASTWLENRASAVENELKSLQIPHWAIPTFRDEMAALLANWQQQCQSLGTDATSADEIRDAARPLDAIAERAALVRDRLHELSAVYQSLDRLNGPALGDGRDRLHQLQNHLLNGGSDQWTERLAVARQFLERELQSGNSDLSLQQAIPKLDQGIAEAVGWAPLLQGEIPPATFLVDRRSQLDQNRNQDIRKLYELLSETKQHLEQCQAVAARRRNLIEQQWKQLGDIVGCVGYRVGVPPSLPSFTPTAFESWMAQVSKELALMEEFGSSNVRKLGDHLEQRRADLRKRCEDLLALASPDTVHAQARDLHARLLPPVPMEDFAALARAWTEVDQQTRSVDCLKRETDQCRDSWNQELRAAMQFRRSLIEAWQCFGVQSSASLPSLPALQEGVVLEPQLKALRDVHSGFLQDWSVLRAQVKELLTGRYQSINSIAMVLNDQALTPRDIPADNEPPGNWSAALRELTYQQGEASKMAEFYETALRAEIEQSQASLRDAFPELPPPLQEQARRVVQESEMPMPIDLLTPLLDRCRLLKQHRANLQSLQNRLGAGRAERAQNRARIQAGLDQLPQRPSGGTLRLARRVAALLDSLPGLQLTAEQEVAQLAIADALLRRLQAHFAQAAFARSS
ncbi:MAG: hypothetical protein JNK87_24150 [Bryobacterales bacterium]|nr:hypothetical protein [Bryobacterales bacterium]